MKVLSQADVNRKQILKVVKGKQWQTFKDIRYQTGLNVKEVMEVTGHEPYDIIGTQSGYKQIKYAEPEEVIEAIDYLRGKRRAMLTRMRAFQAQL